MTTEAAPHTKSMAAALIMLQSKLPQINKAQTANVGQYSYRYADLAAITRIVFPLLTECGLSWIAKPTLTAEGRFVLAYALLHVSGEAEEGQYPLPASGSPQQMGSAITYARRYCLCSVTGIAPDEDDDDAAAAEAHASAARPGPQTAQRRDNPRGNRPAAGGPRSQPMQRSPTAGPPLPGEHQSTGGGLIDPRGAQMKRLHATFKQAGLNDRDDCLTYASTVVSREITSTSQLTVLEASRVIEEMVSDPGYQGDGWEPMSGSEAEAEADRG